MVVVGDKVNIDPPVKLVLGTAWKINLCDVSNFALLKSTFHN